MLPCVKRILDSRRRRKSGERREEIVDTEAGVAVISSSKVPRSEPVDICAGERSVTKV